MAQAVSRRPLTEQARVRSRISPCGICGGQNGTGTGFSPPPPPSMRFSPVNFIPPVLHYKEKIKSVFQATTERQIVRKTSRQHSPCRRDVLRTICGSVIA
jgi:hypothetical protein